MKKGGPLGTALFLVPAAVRDRGGGRGIGWPFATPPPAPAVAD